MIEEQKTNICQIEAIRDGKTVYSDTWNNYTSDNCLHVMSVTKSIVALLVGIAIDKGQIKSVDDKVLDYFPEYKVKRGEKTIYDVTIKHLLTMRSPYKCKGDPWSKVYKEAYPAQWIVFEKVQQQAVNKAGLCPVKYYDTDNPHIIESSGFLQGNSLAGYSGT